MMTRELLAEIDRLQALEDERRNALADENGMAHTEFLARWAAHDAAYKAKVNFVIDNLDGLLAAARKGLDAKEAGQ